MRLWILFTFLVTFTVKTVVAKDCVPDFARNRQNDELSGFCADLENLPKLCWDLEISASKDHCSEFDGSWCCYDPTPKTVNKVLILDKFSGVKQQSSSSVQPISSYNNYYNSTNDIKANQMTNTATSASTQATSTATSTTTTKTTAATSATTTGIKNGMCKGLACLGIPIGCENGAEATCGILSRVTSRSADILAEIFVNPQKNFNIGLNNRWFGVGFSPDGDMPNSPVFICVNQNGTAMAVLTYNVQFGFNNVGWSKINQTQLTNGKASFSNSGASCSAVLSKKLTVSSTSSIDLSSTPYSLIIATGQMVRGRMAIHDIHPVSTGTTQFSFK